MIKQSKKPLKTTKIITSSRNTPKVNIEQHFKHSKKIVPNQGIESLPFILDSEESVKSLTSESKKRSKTPKTPLKAPQSTSANFNLSELSNASLDKKVEILNDKISAIEQDIALSFRSQSNHHVNFPYTPAPSHNYLSEYSLSPPNSAQDLNLHKNVRFDSHDFPEGSPSPFADLDQFYEQIGSARSHKSTNRNPVVPLFDLNKFDKPVISRDDPSYNLRNEIAEYRKNLKKDVLPEKINKILGEKCKINISVQCEEPRISATVNKETEFGSGITERLHADANIPILLQEDRLTTHGNSRPHCQAPLSPRTAVQDIGSHLDYNAEHISINTLNLGNEPLTPFSNPYPALPINKEELQTNYKAAFDEIDALTQFLSTAEQKLTNIKTDFQTCLIEKDDYSLPSEKEVESQEKYQNSKTSTKKVTKPKTNFIQLNRAKVTKEKKIDQKVNTPKKNETKKKYIKKKKRKEKEFNTTYEVSKTPSETSLFSNLTEDQPGTPLTNPEIIKPKIHNLFERATSPIYFADENLLPYEEKPKTLSSPLVSKFVGIGIQAEKIPSYTLKETLKDEAIGTTSLVGLTETELNINTNKNNEEPDHFEKLVNKLAKLSVQKMPKIEIRRPLTKQLAPTLIITPQESIALQTEVENMKYVQYIAEETNVGHLDLLKQGRSPMEQKEDNIQSEPKQNVDKVEQNDTQLDEKENGAQFKDKQNDAQLEKKQKENTNNENKAPQSMKEDNGLSTISEETTDSSSLTIEKIKHKTLENTKLIKEKRKTLTDEFNLKTEDIPSINTLKAIQNYLERKRISLVQQDFVLKSLNPIRSSMVASDTSPDTSWSNVVGKEPKFKSDTLAKHPTDFEIKTCFEQSQLLLEKMKNLSFKAQNLSQKVETESKNFKEVQSIGTGTNEVKTSDAEGEEIKLKDTTILFQSSTSSENVSFSLKSIDRFSLNQTKSSLKSDQDPESKSEGATGIDSYSDDFENYYQTGQSTAKTMKTKENSTRSENIEALKLDTSKETKVQGDTYSISSTERSSGTDQNLQQKVNNDIARLSAGEEKTKTQKHKKESSSSKTKRQDKELSSKIEASRLNAQKQYEAESSKAKSTESKVQTSEKSAQTNEQQSLTFRCTACECRAPSNKRSARSKEEEPIFVIKKCECGLKAKQKVTDKKKDQALFGLRKEEGNSSGGSQYQDNSLKTSYRQGLIIEPYREISIQTDKCNCDPDQKDIAKISQQTEEMRMELSNMSLLLSKMKHEDRVQTEEAKNDGRSSAMGSDRHVTFSSDPSELLLKIDLDMGAQSGSKVNSPRILSPQHPEPTKNKMANRDKMASKEVPIICSPNCNSPKNEKVPIYCSPNSTGPKNEKENSTFEETHYLNLPGTSREVVNNSRELNTNYEYLEQFENTNYDKTIPIYNLFVNPSYSTPVPKLFGRSSPQKLVQTPVSSISETYTEPIDSLSEGEIMFPCKCSTSIGETHLCKFAKSIKMKLNKSAKQHPNKILTHSIGVKNIAIQKQRRNLYTDNFVTYTYGYKDGKIDLSSGSDPHNSSSEYTSSYP